MRFRLGLVTGLATGYYLGARAGRQRYDQMNRALAKLRRSDAYEEARERARTAVEEAAELARSVVEEGVEKARSVVDSRTGNSTGNGHGADTNPGDILIDTTDPETASGIILPGPGTTTKITDPPTGSGGYSSSR